MHLISAASASNTAQVGGKAAIVIVFLILVGFAIVMHKHGRFTGGEMFVGVMIGAIAMALFPSVGAALIGALGQAFVGIIGQVNNMSGGR